MWVFIYDIISVKERNKMKKFLPLLLSTLVLAACDKPTSTSNLTCNVDKGWRYDRLYISNNYYDFSQQENIDVKFVTYNNYAKVTVDNITTTFEKVAERKDNGEFGYVSITYKGNFPGSERTALLSIYADITKKLVLSYNFSFIGQKMRLDNGKEMSVGLSCDTRDNVQVTFNHNYKMPNKVEKCITDICNKVYCGDEKCSYLYILNEANGKQIQLSQQDALSLSKNWDYSNMKVYQNDGKLEAHEKDACSVLTRINKFIQDKDLFFDAYKEIQNAIDHCDNCDKILTTGKSGDFLHIIPETPELLKIANKQKNSKFVSIFNPNSYAKPGYCLVNVVPYKTLKTLGAETSGCNYRIYCGAPEYMNYDEFYAVEVCKPF